MASLLKVNEGQKTANEPLERIECFEDARVCITCTYTYNKFQAFSKVFEVAMYLVYGFD